MKKQLNYLFVFIFSVFLYESTSAKQQTFVSDTIALKTAYITINNVKLYYAEAGVGTPVLFLHGSLGTGEKHFAKQFDEFAKTHHVIALDMRGHGRSELPDGPFAIDLFTDDVFKFLQALKVDSVNLVGFSLGGVVGLHLAIQHPEKVKKLMTIGAFSTCEALSPKSLEWIKNWDIDKMADNMRKQFTGNPAPEKLNIYMQNLQDMFVVGKKWGIKDEDLRGISCPTLLILGENDFFSGVEHQVHIYRTIPKSDLFILPRTGHNAQISQPEIVNKFLAEFMRN